MAQYPKSFRDDVEQVGGLNVIPVEDVGVRSFKIRVVVCDQIAFISIIMIFTGNDNQ